MESNIELRTKCYKLVETLVASGRRFDSLPVGGERAIGIAQGRITATAHDLRLLTREVASMAGTTSSVQRSKPLGS